jgi:beta-lactamase superfamily II metal-dependent hydrolase
MDNLLQQGITAYKMGKRGEARDIFITVVEQNPDNEDAWKWMYNVCNTEKGRVHCLKQILRINPNNEKARQLFRQLPISKPASRSGKLSGKAAIFISVILVCLIGVCTLSLLFADKDVVVANSPQEAPIPVEKIIEMTFSAAGAQTAAAYSPTQLPTLSLASASTIIPSPTTIVIPIFPVETNMVGVPIPESGNQLRFYFINVGQGDATLIQTPDGKTVLIDGGETNTGIVSQLQELDIQRIDLMVATHPHSDHIGGLVQVLQSFPVAKVVTSGQPHTTLVYEHFLDGIAGAQAEYVEVKRGDVISLGGIDFHILNPANNIDPDLNENSVVIQFTYGQTTFLMMGDSGADTEAALMSAGIPLKADILKVGHHGSTSSSTIAFLNAVQPKIALYSAGINNQYGHPAPQTLAALQAVGATVYGTDQNGTIDFNVDLNGYTINTFQEIVKATPVLPAVVVATIPPPSVSDGLEIMSVTSPVSKGSNAILTAKTSPNTSCSITVYYKSGPSSASGLESKTADSNGNVSWTWKVGTGTTSGSWRIVVTCNSVTKETTFTVQ